MRVGWGWYCGLAAMLLCVALPGWRAAGFALRSAIAPVRCRRANAGLAGSGQAGQGWLPQARWAGRCHAGTGFGNCPPTPARGRVRRPLLEPLLDRLVLPARRCESGGCLQLQSMHGDAVGGPETPPVSPLSCWVRCVEGEPHMSVAIEIGGKESVLHRMQDDRLQTTLDRVRKLFKERFKQRNRGNDAALEGKRKDKKPKGKGKGRRRKAEAEAAAASALEAAAPKAASARDQGQVDEDSAAGEAVAAAAMDTDTKIWVSDEHGNEVSADVLNRHALVGGHTLHVGEEAFGVLCNMPAVKGILVRQRAIAGFPVRPDYTCEFDTPSAAEWRWWRLPAEHAHRDLAAGERVEVGRSECYTPTQDDVGKFLAVELVPARVQQVAGVVEAGAGSTARLEGSTARLEGSTARLLAGDEQRLAADDEVGTRVGAGGCQHIFGKRVSVVMGEAVEEAPDLSVHHHRLAVAPRHARDQEQGGGARRIELREAAAGGMGVRVVSYNILADAYANTKFAREQLYPYCPPAALSLDYRKQLAVCPSSLSPCSLSIHLCPRPALLNPRGWQAWELLRFRV